MFGRIGFGAFRAAAATATASTVLAAAATTTLLRGDRNRTAFVGVNSSSVAFANSDVSSSPPEQPDRAQRLRAALSKYRSDEREMIERWERDEEEHWRFLPARAWPAYQPKVTEIPKITDELRENDCLTEQFVEAAGPDDQICVGNSDGACAQAAFDFATALLFNNLDCDRGLRLFRRLASGGHVDGMVAAGIVLLEGLGVDAEPQEGILWLQKACDLGSVQAHYEMGTVYYNGVEGYVCHVTSIGIIGNDSESLAATTTLPVFFVCVLLQIVTLTIHLALTVNTNARVIDEDEQKAFQLFEKAAQDGHVGAMYMTADCLLNGVRPCPCSSCCECLFGNGKARVSKNVGVRYHVVRGADNLIV